MSPRFFRFGSFFPFPALRLVACFPRLLTRLPFCFLRLRMNSLWNHFFSISKFQIKWKLPQREYQHTAVLLEALTPPPPQIHKTRIHLLPKQVQPVQKQDKPVRLQPRQQPLALQQSALRHLVCWLDCTDTSERLGRTFISSLLIRVLSPSLLACHSLSLKSLASSAVLLREIKRPTP